MKTTAADKKRWGLGADVTASLNTLFKAWQINEQMGAQYNEEREILRENIEHYLAKAKLAAFTAWGFNARVNESRKFDWVESAVTKFITDRELDKFMPRKLNATALRKAYDEDEQFAARCKASKAVNISEGTSLVMSAVKVA